MILVFDTSNLSTDICKTIFVIGRLLSVPAVAMKYTLYTQRLYWTRIGYPHNHVVRIRNYPHHSLSARGTKNKVKSTPGRCCFFLYTVYTQCIHTIFQYFGESFGISQ